MREYEVWNTEEILSILKNKFRISNIESFTDNYGDYNSDEIHVKVDDFDLVKVCGFNTVEYIKDKSNCQISFITVGESLSHGMIFDKNKVLIDEIKKVLDKKFKKVLVTTNGWKAFF